MHKIFAGLICALLLGCLATENRKVEVTSQGVAPTSSNVLWWRTPYTTNRAADNPWDIFVAPKQKDEIGDDLEYFEHNVIKCPKIAPKIQSGSTVF